MPGASSTVSSLVPSPVPQGNADTITNALGPFRNANERALIYRAASTGFFTYDEPSCGGVRSGPGAAALLPGAIGGGAGIASSLVKVGSGAAKALPVVGGLLEAFVGILGAHHAAAVATEQQTLCNVVPDFNNFLASIDAAMQQGQAHLSDATQVLEQGFTAFQGKLAPILKQCNAACVYVKAARAAVEYRKQNYALITAASAAGSQGVIGGVVSAIGGAIDSLTGGVFTKPVSAPVPGVVPGAAPVVTASLFGGAGGGLTQSQAKVGIVLVVSVLAVAGIVFVARGKKSVKG